MKSKLTLNSISFLLFTLLLVKVSALHVYSHQDSPTDAVEDCTLCEVLMTNQQVELIASDSYTEASPNRFFFNFRETSRYVAAHTSFTLRSQFFGRPPPAIG